VKDAVEAHGGLHDSRVFPAIVSSSPFGGSGQGRSATRCERIARIARPGVRIVAVGFITNFSDTLGIGSFAPTTTAYKALRLVPDGQIPGTMIVGVIVLPSGTPATILVHIEMRLGRTRLPDMHDARCAAHSARSAARRSTWTRAASWPFNPANKSPAAL
jgi:hypothetical protein